MEFDPVSNTDLLKGLNDLKERMVRLEIKLDVLISQGRSYQGTPYPYTTTDIPSKREDFPVIYSSGTSAPMGGSNDGV